MGPVILPIWGPFAIHSYGFFIALGALVFVQLIQRDQRFKLLNLQDSFSTIFLLGIVCVLFGGRLVHVWREYDLYGSWTEWFALWEPGFAVLGSIAAVVCIMPLYLAYKKIPVLPLMDLAATYAPLMQSIARFGCFFAGCCYGCAGTMPWAVHYTHPDSLAPLYEYMHPVQVYSSMGLLIAFLIMYFYVRPRYTIAGQSAAWYLGLAGCERFITDFWRGDREVIVTWHTINLSFHQLMAIGMMVGAIILFYAVTYWHKNRHSNSSDNKHSGYTV